MAKSILNASVLQNETAAYAWVETRLWPNGPVCPHCGGVDRISKMAGKSTRIGTYKCYQCRKPFTVKVGTIFESSHVQLRLWLQAMFLLASSKEGISANQLARTLGCTLKTGWFIGHRIREAMKDLGIAAAPHGLGRRDRASRRNFPCPETRCEGPHRMRSQDGGHVTPPRD